MPDWTPEQKKAIDSRGGTVLVSAAAGSGKTAVLVERVIRRLMDKEKPCSADRLLIVTFTRAATQQMRERIFQAISDKIRENPEDTHLKHQLVMLPFANISTIDSFCNDIVKENFHDVDIAPDYKLLEGAQLKLIEADAISRTLDEFYKENSDSFGELLNILANGTSDRDLEKLVKDIYNNSTAFAQPEKWLDSLLADYESKEPLAKSRWGKIIINRVADTVKHYRNILEKMYECMAADSIVGEKYANNVREVEANLEAVEKALETEDWNTVKNALEGFSLSKMAIIRSYSSPESLFVKEQKNAAGKSFDALASLFFVTEEENAEDMAYLKPVAEKLICIVKRYGQVLREEKQKINSVDFSDISHLALNMLVNYSEDGSRTKTVLAETVSAKFDEILVDEFQDINEIQNDLFWAVSRNDSNLFTVGDVKQSIYRFRQAMPEIFLRRRDSMPDYEDGIYPGRITLDRNFRSRRGVTENVNFVFRQLMSKEAGGLDYDRGEELVAAANYAECDCPQTELCLIGNLPDGMKVSREAEAQCIADMINNHINDGFTVKENDSVRDVQYRDFCILMRSTSNGKAEIYADILTQNNIPVYISNRAGFFSAAEISSVLNLMRVIDNPVQDIPLLATLLSPFYGFTADELAKLRIDERKKPLYHCVVKAAENKNRKCADFLKSLEQMRTLSSTLSCTEFVRELYDITGCKAMANAMKNGSQRNANLNMLLDYASKYEESGRRGLSGFIRFIDRVKAQDGDLESASDISEAANVVRIMTIHKSKGLEFPVCILADLNLKFFNDNEKGVAAYHPDYGVCFTRRDGRTKCQYSTVGRKALTFAEADSAVSEELRVLYVAMTRAKEKLVCMTRFDNLEGSLSQMASLINGKEPFSPFAVLNRGCMASWIVMSFLRHPDAEALRNLVSLKIPVLESDEKLKVTMINEISEAAETVEADGEEAEADDELLEEIKERVGYKYPYASLSLVRAKSAPSEFDKNEFSTEYFAASKPQFLSKSGMNPAARGTATHKFMEFYDYNSTESVDAQAKRMVAENRLTDDEEKILEKDRLERFFSGEIAERIRKSPLLMREKKITVGIKAGELYPDLPENVRDEIVVIEGYVDCAFEENGGIVIVDYKTDRKVTLQELRERYRTQLKMYEKALGECTGRKITGTLIYSFENGDYIEL